MLHSGACFCIIAFCHRLELSLDGETWDTKISDPELLKLGGNLVQL